MDSKEIHQREFNHLPLSITETRLWSLLFETLSEGTIAILYFSCFVKGPHTFEILSTWPYVCTSVQYSLHFLDLCDV